MTKRAKLIMIQGTTSGAGKSTIAIGLCRLFSDRGYNVAPFKAQNMSSNFFTTSGGSKMALVQAIQAVAARKEPDSRMNPILLKPLDSLRSENDVIVIEGAGSPSEINIAKYDIANMLLAQEVGAPVIIVADIERGGCFASIVGTAQLLKPTHRAMVKGFLINKFRGDITLIAPAVKEVQKITKKRILGIIPKIEFNLPEEDSLVGSVAGKAEVPRESWNWQIDLIAKAIKENIDMERMSKVVGL